MTRVVAVCCRAYVLLGFSLSNYVLASPCYCGIHFAIRAKDETSVIAYEPASALPIPAGANVGAALRRRNNFTVALSRGSIPAAIASAEL